MIGGTETSARSHIFISYRRDDARGASGRLYDWIGIAFGRDRVFRDVHSIGVGRWRDKIDAAIARSAVFVAVIGPNWANANNLRRLHDIDDMVRHEIITALASPVLVAVPTLVDGAQVATDILPTDIQPLFSWNARSVSEVAWEDDTRRLIDEIARESGLSVGPNLDELISYFTASQRRVVEQEVMLKLQADQISDLRRTIDKLRSKVADSPKEKRSTLIAAFAALAHGDTLGAENAFEVDYEKQRLEDTDNPQKLALAARNVANMALLRDVSKSVRFYRKALAADPEHLETQLLLAHSLVLSGELQCAHDAYTKALQEAISRKDAMREIASLLGLGRVSQNSKNLLDAQRSFERALEVSDKRVAMDASNILWQYARSLSQSGLGSVFDKLGDLPRALAHHRISLETRKLIEQLDPRNLLSKWELSRGLNDISRIQEQQGDLSEALEGATRCFAICNQLWEIDKRNPLWQHSIIGSLDRIGDLQIKQGLWLGAHESFQRSLALAKELVNRDPNNVVWQRDLALSHSKIGYSLFQHGRIQEALDPYRSGLSMFERLSERDPSDLDLQRDIAVSYNKIGDVLFRKAPPDLAGASDAYNNSLKIREKLVARDENNAQFKRDYSQCLNKVGDMYAVQGALPEALGAYRKSREITETLAEVDQTNTELQRDQSLLINKIGDVLSSQGDKAGAREEYLKCLDVRRPLAARDQRNAQWQMDLVASYERLAALNYGDDRSTRRDYLRKGIAILLALKGEGRLLADEDRTVWFEQQLRMLDDRER